MTTASLTAVSSPVDGTGLPSTDELAVTRYGDVVQVGPADLTSLRRNPITDERWQQDAACADNQQLFSNGAGIGRVVQALLVCSVCPVMNECRSWALGVDVDGVCGGLTEQARQSWQKAHGVDIDVDAADYLGEDIASQEAIATIDTTQTGHGSARGRAQAVLVLANRGHSATEIADMAGCSVRSVNRLVAIAVHNYGMTLAADAVIRLSAEAPVSIADRVVGGRPISVR